MRRMLALCLVLAAAGFLAYAAGIYCSSYTETIPSEGMICRQICVFCIDEDNANALVGLSCYDEVCWFGFRQT